MWACMPYTFVRSIHNRISYTEWVYIEIPQILGAHFSNWQIYYYMKSNKQYICSFLVCIFIYPGVNMSLYLSSFLMITIDLLVNSCNHHGGLSQVEFDYTMIWGTITTRILRQEMAKCSIEGTFIHQVFQHFSSSK